MNKSELVELIAEKADISKAKAALAVDAFTAGVADALAKGDEVALVGFGTFTTAKREARKGRNPATGKEITIAAATLPKFRPQYLLYDNKPCVEDSPDQCKHCLAGRVASIGDKVGFGEWGDSPHYFAEKTK